MELKEKNFRLTADQVSGPVMARSCVEFSEKHFNTERTTEIFRILYKSRAQSSKAQLEVAEAITAHIKNL